MGGASGDRLLADSKDGDRLRLRAVGRRMVVGSRTGFHANQVGGLPTGAARVGSSGTVRWHARASRHAGAFDGALRARDSATVASEKPADGGDPGETTIRVAIADDSLLIREALDNRLGAADGVEVVASCADRDALLAAIEAEDPNVVVTDIRMPPTDSDEGLEVALMLRRDRPEIGVVLLSQFADPQYGIALLEDGAERRAYLLKERVQYRGQLVSAIRTVANGGSLIDPKVVEALIAARQRNERSPLSQLTPRELQILGMIACGQNNQAIADELVLTKRAVEKHINEIFRKLELTSVPDISQRVKATLIYLAETNSF
jgi:DNA-binding NarL/FixJ family response regulator